ncbi:hypothetical protein HHI36_019319 [Cryptolaemus montrouzieri]|uniref:cGMP-dependent protein kinase n=1 Tax=Cryptolaemus montrouzieri TaxID=559131 RepID=A0ABD2P3C2_9CUCU
MLSEFTVNSDTYRAGAVPPLRDALRKSHTCGSLFAKCGCNNGNKKLFHTYSHPETDYASFSNRKRSSIPEIAPLGVDITKRLSNPEVQAYICVPPNRRASTPSKSGYRTNVYLNHPEINFPIPVQLQSRPSSLKSQRKVSSFEEYEDEKEEEFLQNFGIVKTMGNGVNTSMRIKTSVDEKTLKQIRKNSACLTEVRKKQSYEDEEKREAVEMLRVELEALDVKYKKVYGELLDAQMTLKAKESEIIRMQREIHKLKSVLQQTRNQDNILSSLQEDQTMANAVPKIQHLNNTNSMKKQGVSAESNETSNQASEISIVKHEKDFRSKQLIKDAIMDNDFLKNLDVCQVREIVDSMYQKEFPAGSYVIRENEAGAHLFVSAEGDFEIMQDGKVLGRMGPGKAFGELAILYNCKRTASIKVVNDSKVWVLDRRIFQLIMVRTGLQRLEDNISFLRSVPLLENLSTDLLAKIADALEVEFYPAGVHILRQGTRGDTFFIISNGNVRVTQRIPGVLEEKELRILNRGDYFGEQALLKEDVRTASVISMHPGVECLTLDTESFKHLIGDLSEIKEKSYEDHQKLNGVEEDKEFDYIRIDDLEVIATLGVGGFGRVELVQYTRKPSLTFALKCLKKQHIVDTQQQRHVFSERNVMLSCRSPFITRLYRTFKDSKYVYMLLEACLGGEVWTTLRDRGCFDDHTARFISACVVEAFDYLHSRGIIYRDLKPENLLLDLNGYVKLVDFGFSKNLGYTGKTWTFCGTPEYVAPETILNKGHDRAVDYWALGILLHELLTGNPPFTASDPMKIYNLILKGIDMVDFTKHNVGRSAQSLIKKLCRESASERLGYQKGGIQDIRKHRWFQGFDWDGLVSRSLQAPIVQPIRSPCDTTNFDCFTKDNDIPPDENSNWDFDF